MESRINAWVQWTASELKELAEDEDSCVYFEKRKRHIALQPFHLNNLNKALNEILSKSIYQFDPELKGLLLSYKNPKLLSSLGSILYDSYFIHVDIEADFYIFRPEIGCTLNGIVNKQATNHIGVLVHKAFHVSIPINEANEAWQGHDAYVGQDVKFTVTELDFKGKLPFIRGKLLSDSTLTNDDDENSQLASISSKHRHGPVNGVENEGIEDKTDEECTATKSLKPSKHMNFLSSVLNQSSESSSEEERQPVKKSRQKKHKGLVKDAEGNMEEKICAIEHGDYIPSPSKDEDANNDTENERRSSEKKVKKPSKSRKNLMKDSKQTDESDKLKCKKLNELKNNEVNGEVPPVPAANPDRKPRIIHDHMLNGNEHSIKIERKPMNSSKKKSIFAHDISDSDDDSDTYRRVLTQSTYLKVTEKNNKNGGGNFGNGLGIANAVETDDESEKESVIMRKKGIKHEKERIEVADNDMDTKEHLRNNLIATTSTPIRASKFNEDSPMPKIIQSPVNDHADTKDSIEDGRTDGSTDISSTEDEQRMKKKLKKKLKKLTTEVPQETNIDRSPSFLKIERERGAPSPRKSHKKHEISSASENESIDFKSPKKIKIRKDEANLFANVKIKREPDASDIENSSSSKIDRGHKSSTLKDTDSFTGAAVKSEPVNVKTEVKHKSERKRKHKDENKNVGKVKCEADTSDSDTSFLPRKKIKTIFSE